MIDEFDLDQDGESMFALIIKIVNEQEFINIMMDANE
jgi:hypothetical protein